MSYGECQFVNNGFFKLGLPFTLNLTTQVVLLHPSSDAYKNKMLFCIYDKSDFNACLFFKGAFVGRFLSNYIANYRAQYSLPPTFNPPPNIYVYIFSVENVIFYTNANWPVDSYVVNTIDAGYLNFLQNRINNYRAYELTILSLNNNSSVHPEAICIQLNRTNPLNVASGQYSIAIGDDTRASGLRSVALGNLSIAEGEDSIAFHGAAYGKSSFAINGNAYGESSVAIYQGAAYGRRSLAISGTAHGENSIAFGPTSFTTYEAENSYAIGWGAIVSGKNSICVGPGVVDTDNTIFVNNVFVSKSFYGYEVPQLSTVGQVNVLRTMAIEFGEAPVFVAKEYEYFDIIKDPVNNNYYAFKLGHKYESPLYKTRKILVTNPPNVNLNNWILVQASPYSMLVTSSIIDSLIEYSPNSYRVEGDFVVTDIYFFTIKKQQNINFSSIEFSLTSNIYPNDSRYDLGSLSIPNSSEPFLRLVSFTSNYKLINIYKGYPDLKFTFSSRATGGSFVGCLLFVGFHRVKVTNI